MAVSELTDWMDEYAKPGTTWYVKRLSANDTLATNAHQGGPYVPKAFIFETFPSLNTGQLKNPDIWFDLFVDSHLDARRVRAVYYNGKRIGDGTRDEARLTNFGGRDSPLLDPESTGSLTVFAFRPEGEEKAVACHVWLSRHDTEEDLIEERIGPVEPGQYVVWNPAVGLQANLFASAPTPTSCSLAPDQIPSAWLTKFPTGEEIITKSVGLRSSTGTNADVRLLRRRTCEYELFRSVEQAFYLPKITAGFTSVDGFVALAQTILQSRKSRSGNSLELHARQIFLEEGLRSMVEFHYKPIIENGKRPDFLFPSQQAYDDASFPPSRLRMLAAKTTCKDRWRQIINEADRIPTKHLLTLQEGVSEAQFREMKEAGVQLVVPTGIHESFPASVRPHLMSFESFIADARLAALGVEVRQEN